MISVQIKSLKGHAEKLKEKLSNALKDASDANLAQKEGKYQVLDLKYRMYKTILNYLP